MSKLDELKDAAEDLQSDGFGTLHVPIDTILKLIAVVEAAKKTPWQSEDLIDALKELEQ